MARSYSHIKLLALSCVLLTGSTLATAATLNVATNGNTPAARAVCGPGSSPETALQGQVPLADRENGRSTQGYSCNMKLVGQYQGEGTTVVSANNARCAYIPTSGVLPSLKDQQGVQVLDVSNPAKPVLVRQLTTRAFKEGTWESLKISPNGKLLVGAGAGFIEGFNKLDVYDISADCRNPRLLNRSPWTGDSLPVGNIGHEGEWSPDSKTFWVSAPATGSVAAIDLSNPAKPRQLHFSMAPELFTAHGMSLSADGRTVYLATNFPAGITVLDVSDIQNRKAWFPKMRKIGRIEWLDGVMTQRAMPLTIKNKPYLMVNDEGGVPGMARGGLRFIDISDLKNPRIVSHLRLEIQLPANQAAAKADSAKNGVFGYDTHYCSVDKTTDPTALACGYFQSGIRLFDIRDIYRPKEVAYFNPPAQTGKTEQLPGSDHAVLPLGQSLFSGVLNIQQLANDLLNGKGADLSADWCSSPPQFMPNNQLWVSCMDNGFMVLQMTNGVYPLR